MNNGTTESTTISAILIDDDPEAIHLLEMYLRHFASITITDKSCDAIEGLNRVTETLPDLVFLDIDMPGMNGLQVADQIASGNYHSEIVFTTAHQHYAYDTLGVEPLYFLTKPFNIEDLKIVIEKFFEKKEKKKDERKLDNFIQSQAHTPKIKIPTNLGVLIVEIKEIVLLKANENNCTIHLLDGSVETSTRSLSSILKIINSPAFFRLNRSTIVNMNYLTRVNKKTLKCIIRYNNKVVEEVMSRNQMTHFEKLNLYTFIPNL